MVFPSHPWRRGLEHPRQPIRDRLGSTLKVREKVWKSFYNNEGVRREASAAEEGVSEKGGESRRLRHCSLLRSPSRPDRDLGAPAGPMGAASCEDEELEFKLVFGEEKGPPRWAQVGRGKGQCGAGKGSGAP